MKYHSGVTIGLDFFRPTSGYSVAIPGHEKIFDKLPTQSEIFDYIQANMTDLSCYCNFIGGWVNDGLFYLDISTIVEDKDRALRLAKDGNQLAIFDLTNKIDINI